MTTRVILTNNGSPLAVNSTPAANSIPIADSNGTLNSWINPSPSKSAALEFTHGGGIPANGYRYLKYGGVACTAGGAVTTAAYTNISIAVNVDPPNITGFTIPTEINTYEFQVITNPTASIPGASSFFPVPTPIFTPTILATVSLPPGAITAMGNNGADIPAGTELGVRVIRTPISVSSTSSTFYTIAVLVLLS